LYFAKRQSFWVKRYFILRDEQLLSFLTDDSECTSLFPIPLKYANLDHLIADGNEPERLLLTTQTKGYFLRTEETDSLCEWMELIQESIRRG
jgi:hypothetical protein